MPSLSRIRAISAVLTLFFAAAPALGEELLEGTPEIIDGDTLVLDGMRLQLVGIDAPELGQACVLRSKGYDCGDIARSALLDLTAGSRVTCRRVAPNDTAPVNGEPIGAAADGSRKDGGPALCTVDGYDLSEGMVYTGWALAAPSERRRYGSFQSGARAAKRGLWRGAFVTPWDWRDGKRLAMERDGLE